MIHTNRIVTVGEQESIIDRPIVLYRGDREVEIEFTLVGNEFTFSEEGNVIKSVNASHGQLVLNTPSGEHMFSELAECHEGKVVFVVTKEMIDEFIEMGFYSFQIRLYDSAEMKSRVTIPPVMNGFDIRNPIAAEDETNVVDQGIVDYARVFKDQSNEELPTFTWNGEYVKTEWAHHDVITENKMNKIEDALYSINANIKESDVVMLNALDNVKKDADKYVKEHMAEVEADVDEFERNLNTDVQQFKIDTNAAMTAHKNEVSEELEGFSTQLADIENSQKSIVINVLQPPNNLNPLVCDGTTDNSSDFQAMINYASDKEDATIYFPNNGVYYFSKQNEINNSELNLILRGENTSIFLENVDNLDNLSWVLIRNASNIKIEGFTFKSNSVLDNTTAITCNNADSVTLDWLKFYNLSGGFKLNFNYNLDNQFKVNNLITNNIHGVNVKNFMHICNVDSWKGNNLIGITSKEDDNDKPNVAFYLRPGIHNVDLNNLHVEGCEGDVFHFNRVDYEGTGVVPPFGTTSYIDTNIKINNVTAIDFGNLIGINSEIRDIILTNVYCEKQTRTYGGVIQAYEGCCENVTISGFVFKDIKKLISLTSTETGGQVNHRGIGNINLSNGKLYGELNGDQSVVGDVGCLNLSNIDFYDIDSDSTTGALFLMLVGNINKVMFNNLNFNLNNNVQRVAELIRFAKKFNGKAYINNIVVNRGPSDFKLNVFTQNGAGISETSKIYLSNVFAYNLGNYAEIYYGDSKYIVKNNCYIDDVLN